MKPFKFYPSCRIKWGFTKSHLISNILQNLMGIQSPKHPHKLSHIPYSVGISRSIHLLAISQVIMVIFAFWIHCIFALRIDCIFLSQKLHNCEQKAYSYWELPPHKKLISSKPIIGFKYFEAYLCHYAWRPPTNNWISFIWSENGVESGEARFGQWGNSWKITYGCVQEVEST